jgi:hypothetical protein
LSFVTKACHQHTQLVFFASSLDFPLIYLFSELELKNDETEVVAEEEVEAVEEEEAEDAAIYGTSVVGTFRPRRGYRSAFGRSQYSPLLMLLCSAIQMRILKPSKKRRSW